MGDKKEASRKDAIITSSPNISQMTAANTSQQSVTIKPLKAGLSTNAILNVYNSAGLNTQTQLT